MDINNTYIDAYSLIFEALDRLCIRVGFHIRSVDFWVQLPEFVSQK
jgi:hypothetical protein